MTATPLVIVGGGAHAREVVQLVEDINAASASPAWELLGHLVEAGHAATHGAAVLGGLEWLSSHPGTAAVLGIGDPGSRQRIAAGLPSGIRSPVLVHPRAWVASGASLDAGAVVFAGSFVNATARVGRHVSVNLGCTISHDCDIGDFTSLGPGVHLAGGVMVGAACDLGVACCARPRARIGTGCVVGAGAVVISDLPPGCRAVGNPAKPLKHRS